MNASLLDLNFDLWQPILLSLIPALLNLGIFLYILFKMPRNQVTYTFAIIVASLFCWQLSISLIRMSDNIETARMWLDLLWLFSVAVAPAGLHFALYFTGRRTSANSPWVVFIIYFPAIFFEVCSRAGFIVRELKPHSEWGYVLAPADSLLGFLELWWISGLGFATFIVLTLYAMRDSNTFKRRVQALLIAVGFAIPTIQGTITQIILPYLFFTSEIPVTSSFMTIFSVTTVIALSRYEMFNFSPEYAAGQIIETMNDAMCVVDKDNIIYFFNNQFRKMTGYKSNELLERDFGELLHEKDREQLLKRIHANRQQGILEQYEMRLRKKSGGAIWILMSDSPILDRDQLCIGSIALLTDFTRQKNAEEDLKKRNEDLNTLIYAASHDLKTPLRGIATLVTWLKEDLNPAPESERAQNLDLLLSRSVRLHDLMDGLIEFSEIGLGPLLKKEVHVDELIEEALTHVQIPEDVQVIVRKPMPELCCAPAYLTQVFVHLIANAAAHGHAKGRTTEIHITCRDNGPSVAITVADTGKGIDEKYHAKIFELFQTLEPWDMMETRGVGLPVVKKIVELHGGEVSFASTKGKGVNFTFTIPKY
ncbi:MAG: ATP-binding protein [Bacteroidia bacterium]